MCSFRRYRYENQECSSQLWCHLDDAALYDRLYPAASWTFGTLTFSEKENRVLQQRPAADMAAVFHGSFQKESEAWLRDQFDQRFALVQLHANLNYILGKRELQDVIIGQDGILFQKQEKPNQERLQTKAGQLRSFGKAAWG